MKSPFRESEGIESLAYWDETPTKDQALRFLQQIAIDLDGSRNLRRVLWELGGSDSISDLDDYEIIEALATQLEQGTFRVWETPTTIPQSALRLTKEMVAQALDDEPSGHRIGFRVVDHQTKKPVGGVSLSLKLPGSVASVTSSTGAHDGQAHIDGLTLGEAEIESISAGDDYELVDIS